MGNHEDNKYADFSDLTTSDASRMLELGLSSPRRPVDDLIDRLSLPGAGDWLAQTLAQGPAGAFGDPASYLAEGKATLDQLLAVKQSSKSLLNTVDDPATRLAALAGYFFAIAAALVQHKSNISSRSLSELEPVLLDLASVTAEPWTSLLAGASAVEGT